MGQESEQGYGDLLGSNLNGGGFMGIDRTRQAIDNLVKNRGETARKIWQIMGGFEPLIPPEAALKNLEHAFIVLRAELIDEAAQLAKDIRAVIGGISPPL